MAKTKQQYIDLGVAHGKAGVAPDFDLNDKEPSWQSAAYSQGYRMAWTLTKAEMNTMKKPLTVEDFRTPRPAPTAVLLHMNFLHRAIATCSDDRRRDRLIAKRGKLARKWAKRVEARG